VAAPVLRPGLQRVDSLLVEQGLAASRTLAQRLIAAGRVQAEGEPVSKPALVLPATTRLTVSADDADRYVSRGGLKLAGALEETGLQVQGRDCLDIGQSTGGFSDCLLQAGARRVVGVDVGHGQLHPRLQGDPRIVALEGINCRHLCLADLGESWPTAGFDLIVGDVSFISLTLILPQLPPLLAADGDMVLLVKPQFELGPQALGKGGVVRDAADYAEVEQRLRRAAAECGLTVRHWFPSPLIGGGVGHIAGNREFFIWLRT
jgi:23S rRNA (cytidine1920-2'-O)/16S rRNA (cytidine1409-2'-O)-methyltransferase